jgi:DNA-binding beta-propeller fold protein YncE
VMISARRRAVRRRHTPTVLVSPVPVPLVEPLEPRALLAGAAPVPTVVASVRSSDAAADTTAFHESLATDNEGNVYVTGHFSGTIDLDRDPDRQFRLTSGSASHILEVFFAKYDAQGRLLWAHRFRGASPRVAVTASRAVYLTYGFGNTIDADPGPGTFFLTAERGELAVVRFDSDGDFVTAVKFHTRKQWMSPIGIGTDANGRVYVAAQSGVVPTPPSPLDYDTVLYGLTGDLKSRYAHRWGAKNHRTEPLDLAVNPDGSVFIAGQTWTGVDFHPARRKVRRVPDGFENRNVFLVRVNPRGQFDWVMGLPGPMHTVPQLDAVAPDGQGGVWVSGGYSTGVDFDPARRRVFAPKAYNDRFRDGFVARYTAQGALARFWSLGEAGDMFRPDGLAVDPASGNLAVTGSLETQPGEEDPTGGQRLTGTNAGFFATYTPTGTLLGLRGVENAWTTSAPGGRLMPAFAGGALYLLGQSGQPTLPTYAPGVAQTSIDIDGADVFVLKVDQLPPGH